MDTYKTSLCILFKEQNPYYLLKQFFAGTGHALHADINKNAFTDLYQCLERQCSQDEAENVFQLMQENMKSVFQLLAQYADDILEHHLQRVYCKYKSLLKWRAVTLKLDQDMFLTAFLAHQDMMMGTKRTDFSWGTGIKSNNIRLHTMLKQGMAENHFHLKGSAPIFQLSWISLMNDISSRELQKFDKTEDRLAKDLDGDVDVTNLIVVAALIRIFLFVRIQKIDNTAKTESVLFSVLAAILSPEIKDEGQRKRSIEIYAGDIQKNITAVHCLVAPKNQYDYAILPVLEQSNVSTDFYVGERNFLYQCFQGIYQKESFIQGYEDLFYAYLIIKNRIRAELIQVNERVGFSNFSKYQGRKGGYLRKNKKLKKQIEPTAVLTTIKDQNIVSLEARIMPQYTKQENVRTIRKLDKSICAAVSADDDNYWKPVFESSSSEDKVPAEIVRITKPEAKTNEMERYKERYFYVVHFPKNRDPLEETMEKEMVDDSRDLQVKNDLLLQSECRHQKARMALKKCTSAICQLRENNQSIARRIGGIDACSNELVARPEVYAQAFRCLKGHLPYEDTQSLWGKGRSLESLRITYHVGEDFLDVVDGLRAIEEAKLFLGMTHGDRLGHAIVLGIDVKVWYQEKNCKVYLSKQAILDNVAWLINKLKHSNFENAANTIAKLTMLYNEYYLQIYFSQNNELYPDGDTAVTTRNIIVPPDTYMKAWELRGDDPTRYQMGNLEEFAEITYWDRCAIRLQNFQEKPDRLTCEMYQRYHYDPQVKRAGNKKDVFKIEPYMIKAIEAVQKDLQKEICACGIGIECNPSSNHLISNFKRYDKHPLINMYNLGLTVDPDKLEACPQLFVSINTDDQGVFDTLLENEYALMAIALEKVKDEDGHPVYKQAMIYDWLDRIRKMGIEQSFRSPGNTDF